MASVEAGLEAKLLYFHFFNYENLDKQIYHFAAYISVQRVV